MSVAYTNKTISVNSTLPTRITNADTKKCKWQLYQIANSVKTLSKKCEQVKDTGCEELPICQQFKIAEIEAGVYRIELSVEGDEAAKGYHQFNGTACILMLNKCLFLI